MSTERASRHQCTIKAPDESRNAEPTALFTKIIRVFLNAAALEPLTMNIYNSKHYMYSISQTVYYSCNKSMAKEATWRTISQSPKIITRSSQPFYWNYWRKYSGNIWLFPECQIICIKWWLGLSRYNRDRSSLLYLESYSFLYGSPAGRDPF